MGFFSSSSSSPETPPSLEAWRVIILGVAVFVLVSRMASAVKALVVPPRGVPAESLVWYAKIYRGGAKTSALEIHRHLMEKFGTCYCTWLGGYTVCVCDPVATKFFFQRTDIFHKGLADNRRKTPLTSRWLGTKSVLMVEGDDWKRQRKMMTPAFHVDKLRAVAPLFREAIDAFVDKRLTTTTTTTGKEEKKKRKDDDDNKDDGLEVDVSREMTKFTVDILGRAAFGHDFKCVSDEPEAIADLYGSLRRRMTRPFPLFLNFVSGFGLWDRLPLKSNADFKREADAFRAFLQDIVAERRREKKSPSSTTKKKKDLLQLMVDGFADGESLSDREFIDNLTIFFLAGHDTTATSLAMALLLLAHHPQVQGRARREVAEATASEKDDYDAQKHMPFLTNVIRETLRLFPPVASIPPRRATRACVLPFSDGSKVHIARGQRVTVAVYSSHLNPKNFHRPDLFDPDRFTDEPPPPFAWIPFGGATRICIGQHFSLIEQRMFLADILRRFTLEPITSMQEANDNFHGPGLLLHPRNILVRFLERHD